MGIARRPCRGGELRLNNPRDRQGAFEPKLVERHQTRWTGFDDKIISLYARGLSVREIQGHLEEIYGTEVSPTLISAVTDAVSEEVKVWQARALDGLYPIVYLDCIHVKVRDSGAVRAKAVYLAIGVNMAGHKEVLGLWIAQTEGERGLRRLLPAFGDVQIDRTYGAAASIFRSTGYRSFEHYREHGSTTAADIRDMALIPHTLGAMSCVTRS
ncbi:hypothetical protein LMG28727_06237 [Paraburkholderia kirstenboschensis]|nr:hypothetical protein LMG28727_06237 [Paraburkholderia kirstenboschensis]